MPPLTLQRLLHLPSEIHTLEQLAVEEGFRFLTRLIDDWNAGTKQFDAPGECLLAGYREETLVAIGGLSIDPYAQGPVGRLRRVYVIPSSRGQGIGKALVQALVQHAMGHFESVRLLTDTVEGDVFYRRCGFQPVEDRHATHTRVLPLIS